MESINTSSTGQKVKILTKEGKELEVEVDLIIRSVTVKGIIDDMSDLQNENIPLPEITEETLLKVIDFLKHLKEGNAAPEIEKPLRSNDMKDVTTEWYANFIDLDDEKVQDIILAANYLDIKELLSLGCAKMGSIIRGLSIPEFRKRFDIVNDFTPEEEAEPFDEAKLAELAEAYEKEQKAKEAAEKQGQEEEKKAE